MKINKLISAILFACIITTGENLYAEPIAKITENVPTDFGVYQPVVVDVVPSVKPYTVKADLSNVVNAGDFDLKDEAKELLGANGFACTASSYRQPYDIYNECLELGIPAFVTTDACLHTYHILYDYMLRILEIRYFFDDLVELTNTMREVSNEIYKTASEQPVKQAALDNVNYFSVAYGLLNPEASDYSEDAAQEISHIYEGSDGYVPSPLFYSENYPYNEDYSQYKPRGHYTRTDTLERYFRAMMWYGRITFSLNLDYATQEGLRHAARQGILLSRALEVSDVGEEKATSVWDRIYQPTIFFVGKTDDITCSSYLAIAEEVFGEDFLTGSPDVLANDAKIDSFIGKALDLPDPKITVKAGKGVRFMGQRYIPDSYVLDQLVEEFVGGRLMPRGLDVMAVLGSARAYEILDTVYEDTKYPNYVQQVAKLKAEFAGYLPEVWAQNLYFNWLYTLLPLLDVKGGGYPLFMQNQAWVDKDLNTALGSWAELRHDTILYAKQSETFETSVPEEPPYVMGYVEPQPEVYARLSALADFMRRGLDSRSLLDAEIGDRLERFEDLMLVLRDISVKELLNITPLPEEFALICNFGDAIESLTSFKGEYEQYENEADDFMAVIADVHTDPNLNEALEVGVGHPLNIYVVAPVDGVPTLTRGTVFSYHEFKWSLADERLTDEEWQKLQSGENAQPMPVWTESFIAGESSTKESTYHYYSQGRKVTGVEEDTKPGTFGLLENRPNPFNPSTVISYRITESAHVTLAVYNLAGQVVDILVDGWSSPGEYTVTWEPENCSSGVYIVRLAAADMTSSIKVMYIK